MDAIFRPRHRVCVCNIACEQNKTRKCQTELVVCLQRRGFSSFRVRTTRNTTVKASGTWHDLVTETRYETGFGGGLATNQQTDERIVAFRSTHNIYGLQHHNHQLPKPYPQQQQQQQLLSFLSSTHTHTAYSTMNNSNSSSNRSTRGDRFRSAVADKTRQVREIWATQQAIRQMDREANEMYDDQISERDHDDHDSSRRAQRRGKAPPLQRLVSGTREFMAKAGDGRFTRKATSLFCKKQTAPKEHY